MSELKLDGHARFYTREECHIDLGKLANFGGVRLVHAEVRSFEALSALYSAEVLMCEPS